MPRKRGPADSGESLFASTAREAQPLAARMRPRILDEFAGQEHLLAPGKPLRYLGHCANLVRPGGLVFVSTISRTLKSLAYAIVMAEYVLRLLPRGTHHWRRFLKPDEVSQTLERDGFATIDVSGVGLDLRSRDLKIVPSPQVNYLLTAARLGPG